MNTNYLKTSITVSERIMYYLNILKNTYLSLNRLFYTVKYIHFFCDFLQCVVLKFRPYIFTHPCLQISKHLVKSIIKMIIESHWLTIWNHNMHRKFTIWPLDHHQCTEMPLSINTSLFQCMSWRNHDVLYRLIASVLNGMIPFWCLGTIFQYWA